MLTDNKYIYIKIRKRESNYGFANRKNLKKVIVRNAIGSSVSAVRSMIGNSEEQQVLMQDIISVAANSGDWNKKLSEYWNSLSIEIPEDGKKLEVGFTYDIGAIDKAGYIKSINANIEHEQSKLKTDKDLKNYIDKRLDSIEDTFNKSIKGLNSIHNPVEREKFKDNAYNVKYTSIAKVESERYKVGNPINALDYMLYRYCLHYSHVANDVELVAKSNNIRFYLQDLKSIKNQEVKSTKLEMTKTRLLAQVMGKVQDMENLLYALGEKEIPSDDLGVFKKVKWYSDNHEEKFIAVAGDKNIKLVGKIEKLIAYGILHSPEGSSVIYNPTNLETPLGNTMEEAIVYFNNPANKATISEFDTKFNNLGK